MFSRGTFEGTYLRSVLVGFVDNSGGFRDVHKTFTGLQTLFREVV